MGPHGSVGAHVKTGRSPTAPDHFWTPPDPKIDHKMAIRLAIREFPRDSRIANAMMMLDQGDTFSCPSNAVFCFLDLNDEDEFLVLACDGQQHGLSQDVHQCWLLFEAQTIYFPTSGG